MIFSLEAVALAFGIAGAGLIAYWLGWQIAAYLDDGSDD